VTLDLYGHLFPDEMDRLAERLDATNADVSPSSCGILGIRAARGDRAPVHGSENGL